ncbi:hypothetical protein UlMin_046076 [Ulmus minor]
MGNEQRQKGIFPIFSPLFHLVFFVIGLSLGITICFYFKSLDSTLAFTLLNFSSSNSSVPLKSPKIEPNLLHNMDDNELFWRASLVPRIREFPYRRVPKVAFLFLIKGPIHLAPLWEMFFKGHEELYNIYVHPHPSYIDSHPVDSVFYGRRIPSKSVQWGMITMINAERRLLASALLDFSNEKFVLLSESCIPMFNFTTTYNYLINTNQSFTNSFDELGINGRGRYNPNMFPSISIFQWRKGSQWFEVTRQIALAIICDNTYYPTFKEHCKPRCYPDEHYVPTLINILFPEKNSNRSVTFVDWSKVGAHPAEFGRDDVSVEVLNQIRFGIRSNYSGNTKVNSSGLFLFARKFLPETLQPLLKIVPILMNSSSIEMI